MKFSRFFLVAAAAISFQAATAQTAPTQSSPNTQSSSSTNTSTQTSSPTTTGMNNNTVSAPAQTAERRMDGSTGQATKKTKRRAMGSRKVKTTR